MKVQIVSGKAKLTQHGVFDADTQTDDQFIAVEWEATPCGKDLQKIFVYLNAGDGEKLIAQLNDYDLKKLHKQFKIEGKTLLDKIICLAKEKGIEEGSSSSSSSSTSLFCEKKSKSCESSSSTECSSSSSECSSSSSECSSSSSECSSSSSCSSADSSENFEAHGVSITYDGDNDSLVSSDSYTKCSYSSTTCDKTKTCSSSSSEDDCLQKFVDVFIIELAFYFASYAAVYAFKDHDLPKCLKLHHQPVWGRELVSKTGFRYLHHLIKILSGINNGLTFYLVLFEINCKFIDCWSDHVCRGHIDDSQFGVLLDLVVILADVVAQLTQAVPIEHKKEKLENKTPAKVVKDRDGIVVTGIHSRANKCIHKVKIVNL